MFHHDKLIGTVKNTEDQIIQLMNNNHYLKYLPIPTSSVTLGHVHSNVHMKLNQNYSSLSVKVNLNSRIEEYKGNKNILNHDELASLIKRSNPIWKNNQWIFLKKCKSGTWTHYRLEHSPLTPGRNHWVKNNGPITGNEWRLT